ncbi:uncharacterized protein LOC114126085 [Aphis gossypii]|uniref:DUF4485 domain-containing protein n=2 Tax=Aphis TaxID=464929 RepID=A0A9P0J5D9_APHGO|nr:uncharacterized protein LOC114126085 [Aphis gossypii]CAH1731224.1 unnamed protein product [Aphis gossypii]
MATPQSNDADTKNKEEQIQATYNENDPRAQSISVHANLSNTDFENASSVRKFLDEDDEPDCPLKNNNELYCCDRETAKTLMYLIDSRDRQKVLTWIRKLDEMNEGDDMLERVHYIRYLVSTLSGTLGLVEPFTSMPPLIVKPLKLILPPVVYADLLKDQPEPCLRKKIYGHKMPNSNSQLLQDKRFYEQQLFPPEGIICYAAAFSVI